jgi:hypothetical protein
MSKNNDFLKSLTQKGWKYDEQRGWHKPNSRILAPIQGAVSELPFRKSIEGKNRRKEKGPTGVAGRAGNPTGINVTLVFIRERLYDTDNNVSSGKALRDAIASSLGVDDNLITWHYHQLRAVGDDQPGTIVKITFP